jgi:hypothetical protein
VFQVVTRLVHFMYTGELVVGAGELGELRSLGRALGAAALLHQIACLEAQLATATPQHALFSLQHRSSGYTEIFLIAGRESCVGVGDPIRTSSCKIAPKNSVLRIRDVYPGSRIQLFSIPVPNCLHTGSASMNLSILTSKKPNKWFLSSRKYDPGCSSRIRMLTFYPSRIPDPGVKKAPDPGSGSATLQKFGSTDG